MTTRDRKSPPELKPNTSPDKNLTPVDMGMVWPAIPSYPQAVALALQFSLQTSEWLSPETLLANQLRQASALLRHAVTSVPYYREKFRGYLPESSPRLMVDDFQKLPLLKRADIQQAGKEIASKAIPVSHGRPYEVRSSGSTGRPIRVLGTGLTNIYVKALTIRGHLWHQRDVSAKNVDIRTARVNQDPNRKYRWSALPNAGESVRLDINLPIDTLIEQLSHEDPAYLQTHPYTLKGLIESSVRRGIDLKNLREARTFGEALDQELRDLARTCWNINVIDNYSAMEVGTMAHQCPHSENLHVQSESVILEVLDDDGTPCSPGEVGRIVVTALHNFATPLIRYEIGDYAEVGEPCPCGRGLPVLKRVLGRQRNFLVLPNGERRFPEAWKALSDIAPDIRQFQITQNTVRQITLTLVVKEHLTSAVESKIAKYLTKKFDHEFDYTFNYVSNIPRAPNGKFEEFKSEVLQRAH